MYADAVVGTDHKSAYIIAVSASLQVHGFGPLSDFEQKLVTENVETLIAQANKGAEFVAKA